jgi:small subunit ribosomal protein S17
MADEEKNETTKDAVEETVEEPVAEAETPDEPVAEVETYEEPASEEEAPTEEEAPAEEPAEPAVEEEEPAEEPAAAEVEAEQPAAEAEAEEPPVEAAEEVATEADEAVAPAVKKKRKLRPRSERRQRPKPVRASEGRKPLSRQPKPEHERGQRQERRGVVVSSAMDKTIVVRVETLKAHRRYKKIIRRSTKFHAHDEQNEANVGDVVRIVETRPLSKTKRWRLAEVVEAAK